MPGPTEAFWATQAAFGQRARWLGSHQRRSPRGGWWRKRYSGSNTLQMWTRSGFRSWERSLGSCGCETALDERVGRRRPSEMTPTQPRDLAVSEMPGRAFSIRSEAGLQLPSGP